MHKRPIHQFETLDKKTYAGLEFFLSSKLLFIINLKSNSWTNFIEKDPLSRATVCRGQMLVFRRKANVAG